VIPPVVGVAVSVWLVPAVKSVALPVAEPFVKLSGA